MKSYKITLPKLSYDEQIQLISEFKTALLNHDLPLAQELLDKGVNVHNDFNFLLQTYSGRGDLDVVKFICSHAKLTSNQFENAFQTAIHYNQINIVEYFIDYYFQHKKPIKEKNTDYSWSSFKSMFKNSFHKKNVPAYVQSDFDPSVIEKSHLVFYYKAIQSNHLDIIDLLIDQLGRPNKKESLMLCQATVYKEDTFVLKHLISKLSITVDSLFAEAILDTAIRNCNINLLKNLENIYSFNNKNYEESLILAAKFNNGLPIVKYFIQEKNVNIDPLFSEINASLINQSSYFFPHHIVDWVIKYREAKNLSIDLNNKLEDKPIAKNNKIKL